MLAFRAANSIAEGQNAGICFCTGPAVLKSSDLQQWFSRQSCCQTHPVALNKRMVI